MPSSHSARDKLRSDSPRVSPAEDSSFNFYEKRFEKLHSSNLFDFIHYIKISLSRIDIFSKVLCKN